MEWTPKTFGVVDESVMDYMKYNPMGRLEGRNSIYFI